MIAIVLHDLQDQFFIDLNAQDEEYWEVKDESRVDVLRAKMKKRAEKFVTFLPPEFFGATWKMKSLNTGGERTVLTGTLAKLRESKGRYNWSQCGLITGKAT
jgi:hypothetical protein